MKRERILAPFMEWLLSFLTVQASLSALISAYSYQVRSTLLPVTMLLCLAFTLSFRSAKGRLAMGVSALAIACIGALFYRQLAADLRATVQQLLNELYLGYSWMQGVYEPVRFAGTPDVTAAFLLLSSVQSWLVCWGVSRLKRTLPSLLAVLPCVSACFFLLDSTPDPAALLFLLGCLCLQMLTQNARRREPQDSGKTLLLWSLPLLLLCTLLYRCCPPQKYTRGYTVEQLAARLESVFQWQTGVSGISDTSASVIRVDRLGRQQTSTREVMQVTTEKTTGLLYLRALAYSDFDGTAWSVNETAWDAQQGDVFTLASPVSPADSDTGFAEGVESGKQPEEMRERVAIATASSEEMIFTPYYLTGYPASAVPRADAWLNNTEGLRDYSVYITSTGERAQEETAASYFNQTVMRQDLALPERTKQALREIAEERGLTNLPLANLPQEVGEFVRTRAFYSLSPEAMPEGEEFCSWFLTAAHSGYCVHFAIAATAMLRAVNIPARFVTGYVVQVQAGQTAVVTEAQAHAWTEYWKQGNWHVLDATPGEAPEFRPPVQHATGQTEETTGEFYEPTPPTDDQSATTETQQAALPTAAQPGNPPTAQTAAEPLPWWCRSVLALAGLVALLVLRRLLAKLHRERLLATGTVNQQARRLWKRATRLLAQVGDVPPPTLRELAQKARFSQHSLTAAELQELIDAVRQAEQRIAALPVVKRLVVCYILALA